MHGIESHAYLIGELLDAQVVHNAVALKVVRQRFVKLHPDEDVEACHLAVVVIDVSYGMGKAVNKVASSLELIHILDLFGNKALFLVYVCLFSFLGDHFVLKADRDYFNGGICYHSEKVLFQLIDLAEISASDIGILIPVFPERLIGFQSVAYFKHNFTPDMLRQHRTTRG